MDTKSGNYCDGIKEYSKGIKTTICDHEYAPFALCSDNLERTGACPLGFNSSSKRIIEGDLSVIGDDPCMFGKPIIPFLKEILYGFNGEVIQITICNVETTPGPGNRTEPISGCTWVYDSFHSYYHTSCGNGFETTDGDIEENNFKYCPYCGKPIRGDTTRIEPEKKDGE